ncbi:hypothetical protein BLNAU_17257 [Blattamonas nauphoetae]|uniref:B30.2/SPRY domain-containing protein n=1 Tax=Blattamonas nauphoetae TaxID=2049346 RepID=A0ABQ9X9C2_9EUKA|nr:hypothetical protein BLNAU_17257 [Blattamonas nauphoetae]
MGHSCSSLKKTETKSNPDITEQTQSGNAPAQLLALPPLLFTSRSHFTIDNTTITPSSKNFDPHLYLYYSSILLKTPITQGIISVTITLLSLPIPNYLGDVRVGLLDSTAPVPKFRYALGSSVKDSVALDSSTGLLWCNTPSTQHTYLSASCHSKLKEGDCVRMEVDMNSTPRTVQFFVNGESGRSFVSGLPPSVRIGFTIYGKGTFFRIDRIAEQQSSTLFAPRMRNVTWE